MSDDAQRKISLFSHELDQPHEARGSLIPNAAKIAADKRKQVQRKKVTKQAVGALVGTSAVATLLFAVVSVYGYLTLSTTQVAAPIITINNPNTAEQLALNYGPQTAFSQKSFFADIRDAFAEEGLTFVEVDLDAKVLRYFENGVAVFSADILATAERGSWWDVPAGLYKVDSTSEQSFSSIAQAEFPWTVTFEGNYIIHGWPKLPGGEPVRDTFQGGGIRIDDAKAEEFFAKVQKGVPVLVHAMPPEGDAFVYQPVVPEIETAHYLIADIENGAILASSDLNAAVPIASLTKLMTAVVAAEKLDLDSRVRVTEPTFVQSLVPRLAERTSVSMYSLLQLLLVESSNEAAEVIAGEYGREAFISEMNLKATQLGMASTKFADPSGLSPENVSTLRDLFTLSQHIHTNRSFVFDITAKGRLRNVTGLDEFANLQNFNDIETVENFIGGKVGETSAAGQTSVSLHTVRIQGTDRTIVVILLGSSSRSSDVKLLIDFVYQQFGR